MNYCIPIQKQTMSEVRQAILEFRESYDFLEVWLDMVTDLELSFVDELCEELGERLILLFRRPVLEKIRMKPAKRQQIMQQLSGRLAWLDLDISTQQDDLAWIQQEELSLRLLLSYHNYDTTPSEEKLWERIEVMRSHSASIVKVATYCQSADDAMRLMQLGLRLKSMDCDCIVLGMGEFGAVTRIFGTLWFNHMTFAPPTLEQASAPGQIALPSLKHIISLLG